MQFLLKPPYLTSSHSCAYALDTLLTCVMVNETSKSVLLNENDLSVCKRVISPYSETKYTLYL